ncbi:hypothetical protein VTN77DRAFT_2449 [Rasamsonia byssochlamydoides]|uniref:uncharacterized protein n=1 Tax=Rasamsonia byssochlamydoides TaxID=89139 RepID=UPI0037420832
MPGAETKSSFLGAISPWTSPRGTTPQPGAADPGNGRDALQPTQGEDHTISHRQRLSQLRYPEDCPPLQPRWFYAVDTPKSKPAFLGLEKTESKPLPPPKKFVPFSSRDSQSIEAAFQQLLRQEDSKHAAGVKESIKGEPNETIKVPVNEDYLFDVDVNKRELSPAYWLGPIYEVRRGTWFFQEGSTLKPCEENLATQLEEGYLKVKPWQIQYQHSRPKSRTPGTSSSNETGKASSHSSSGPDAVTTKDAGSSSNTEQGSGEMPSISVSELPVYRLFGAYMNSTVTYQDSTTAWLNYDDFMSRMSSTVYQRLGGVGGTKVIRGYSEPGRPKEAMDTRGTELRSSRQMKSRDGLPSKHSEDDLKRLKRRSAPDSFSSSTLDGQESEAERTVSNEQRETLQRQMSSLTGETRDTAVLEEEARKREEKEMEDSREADDEERGREIDHLVLVTHGIGQRLGLRLESINFVHDVNVLRKTMKSVYAASPDLQALNSPYADAKKNCRVQVLPVCWRHLLDFPRQGLRKNRKELDLADPNSLTAEDEQYPSLADITLEGVPAVRNLISDLAMDVLLYQSAYREHIMRIVQQECNRIFKLFKSRNPSFRGSVSLCGHSLGSAIMFDILCRQQSSSVNGPRAGPATKDGNTETMPKEQNSYPLDFDCQEFFCLGSPIALFQMLKGKKIVGRSILGHDFTQIPVSFTGRESLTGSPRSLNHPGNAHGRHNLDIPSSVSSPKCGRLYNIFHPSDPVSYRLEPLISPAMTTLKPQPLPSVKKSIWTTSGQSLSNISSRVGSLWTNFTSGVASSLLNRSLGLHSEDSAPSGSATHRSQQTQGGTVLENSNEKEGNKGEAQAADEDFQTLIDTELETLYEGFRKARRSHKRNTPGDLDNAAELLEAEERARKLKIEEAKVRALNSNGRVDYSIQEGAFDISLIASIASHLSYWADEDVNHFMLSQMLSRMRRGRRR